MIRSFSLAALLLVGSLTFLPQASGAETKGDLKFKVQLIWGTNGEKPDPKPGEPALKEVGPKLKEKLAAIFKWKNYYEVGDPKDLAVKAGEIRKSDVSKKCQIEAKNLGESKVELKLFGDGKKVYTHTQTIKPHEPVILAGHAKDETAWFVVLSPQ